MQYEKSKDITLPVLYKQSITIPKDYDYYIIELTPSEHKFIVQNLRELNIRDEIIEKLNCNKTTKGDMIYIFSKKH